MDSYSLQLFIKIAMKGILNENNGLN